MTGREMRLKKLFSGGNAVIVAVDHGEFDGPRPGMEDLPALAEKINPAVDAVLLSPGMLPHCAQNFAVKGAPMPVVRLNWSTTYCFTWGYGEAETVPVLQPDAAAAAGVEVVLVSLTLRTGSENRDARNVEVFGKLAHDAKRLGLAVIGEYFPPKHESLEKDEFHEQIKFGTRIIAELGADAVKTFHTNRFKEVAGGCPVPVLGLGADKLPTQLDALRLARREIDEGARGVVFGRNAVLWPDPVKFQTALVDVVRNGKSPEAAAKAAGL